jgi:hypothetical protein
MTDLRALARDQECTIRLANICNRDSATTVLAHYRISGISGMGLKVHNILGAWACSACHAYVDTHHDNETECSHLRGVIRTQDTLVRLGVLQVKGARDRKPKPIPKILPRRATC